MKINIVSTKHRFNNNNAFFNFKLTDLEYLGDKPWSNKVFSCWYKSKYIDVILWNKSSLEKKDEGHGRSVGKNIFFQSGEFLTFTYNNNDFSEWESCINEKLIKYKDIHKNEICVLLGSGETIRKYKKIENAIHFGVNHVNKHINFELDYYFLNDRAGLVKDTGLVKYKVNKMKFYSYYKKKSNFIKYGEGIYPKYKTILDDSKIPYEYIECVSKRDYRKKKFKWFKDLDRYGLGSSVNTMLKLLQISLYMGFKHIILVGCDCSGTYEPVSELWRLAFKETDILYPDVNITIYNPINLNLKPKFNILNIMVLRREKNVIYFNKYLMNKLLSNNWDDAVIEDAYNNKLKLNIVDETIGKGTFLNETNNNNCIYIGEQKIVKYFFNNNIKNVSEYFKTVSFEKIFYKKNIFLDYKKYVEGNNNKMIYMNSRKEISNDKIINISINFNLNSIVIENNGIKESILLGKILYLLKYYKFGFSHKNISDSVLICISNAYHFNLVSTDNLLMESYCDNKFVFRNYDNLVEYLKDNQSEDEEVVESEPDASESEDEEVVDSEPDASESEDEEVVDSEPDASESEDEEVVDSEPDASESEDEEVVESEPDASESEDEEVVDSEPDASESEDEEVVESEPDASESEDEEVVDSEPDASESEDEEVVEINKETLNIEILNDIFINNPQVNDVKSYINGLGKSCYKCKKYYGKKKYTKSQYKLNTGICRTCMNSNNTCLQENQ